MDHKNEIKGFVCLICGAWVSAEDLNGTKACNICSSDDYDLWLKKLDDNKKEKENG